jgi:hypothetical protein
LNVGVGYVESDALRNFHEVFGAGPLGVKNENPEGDKDSVDGESNDSRGPAEARCESSRKRQSILAAVEIDGQSSGQDDAEKRNHSDENAERTSFERGTYGNSPVHRVPECGARSISVTGMKVLRRKLARRRIQAHGNFSIRNRNLHGDLRSAALRTKRTPVFDRGSTLLARVIHFIEASAQRTGEQGSDIE